MDGPQNNPPNLAGPAEADGAWQWLVTRGNYAQLARYVSAEAIRDAGLSSGRELSEPDIDLARRLYEQLRAKSIAYAPEPHLARSGVQQIRDPWELVRTRIGTCIDFAVAYAGMCLELSSRPLLAVTERHAFVLIAPGVMLADPGNRDPIWIEGLDTAPGEREGVLAGTTAALSEAIARGELFAVDCAEAKRGGLRFDGALEQGLQLALAEQPTLIDVLYLQAQPGLEPLPPPAGHRPIHRHVPEDDTTFLRYDSHTDTIAGLREAEGIVALIGVPGQGKSRIARELARAATPGGGWFLDASGPQALINSLAAVDLAGRAERAGGRARPDREGYALNALALLGDSSAPWVVVLDNANGDPGQIEHLLPRPRNGQLLLITTTNERWAQLRDVRGVQLPAITAEDILATRGPDAPDITALLELIHGRPLLIEAFDALIDATGADAETIAAHAPDPEADHAEDGNAGTDAGADPDGLLRGQRALWAAISHSPGCGETQLAAACRAAHLPPDHQPLAAFEALDREHGADAARYLAHHGLLTYELEQAGRERTVMRMHRTFGEAVRLDLERSQPQLCDEIAVELAGEQQLFELFDVHGDLDTVTRLAQRLAVVNERDGEPDPTLGAALHAIAGLLELHGQTRDSGDFYARAEANLDEAQHPVLVAGCRHGRARTVNQHHQKEVELLRDAVELARSARRLFTENGRDGDHCLAMEGLLLQKLASYPAAGQSELELLEDAREVIEDADRRRNENAARIDPAELARSRFNLAGIRIRLARAEPDRAGVHLDQARDIYDDVLKRRRKIYRRPVHPHIAACVIGFAYVDYFRALLIPADHIQRTAWLREATRNAGKALEQRSALEGSIDQDEVGKVAGFMTKVLLARASAPVSSARTHARIFDEAMGELGRAGIALARVPSLPSEPAALPAAIEAWASSPALARLLEQNDTTAPVRLRLPALLDWLEEFSERWDYRRGKERNLVTAPVFSSLERKIVLAAADALGLVGTPPRRHGEPTPPTVHYDDVLILGGLVRACLARPLHAAKLLREQTITTDMVTALGGFRAVAGDEHGLLKTVIHGESVTDEFDAMDAGMRNAFPIRQVTEERGEESDTTGGSWRIRQYETEHGPPVRVIAAPSSEPETRRANTPDTYAWYATQLGQLEPGSRLLIVTTEIYVPYQHADALRMLALPHGVALDVVGVQPGAVHPALRQTFQPHNYLQEIRSTIRALRMLLAALPEH
jgi:hypothetical protein